MMIAFAQLESKGFNKMYTEVSVICGGAFETWCVHDKPDKGNMHDQIF